MVDLELYAIIGLIIYNLILTLFIVKLSNDIEKLKEVEPSSPMSPLIIQNKPLGPTNIIPTFPFGVAGPTLIPTEPSQSLPPQDLDAASQQFEELMKGKSREEIEKWIAEPKPNQTFKHLNKDYKGY